MKPKYSEMQRNTAELHDSKLSPQNQFTFCRSYYEAILALHKTQQALVLLAVCNYALNGQKPKKLSGASAACFKLIKMDIDLGRQKKELG